MRHWFALILLGITSPATAVTLCEAVWRDEARGRDLPVRIRMPEGRGRVPVVLWSPGLGGGSNGAAVWAAAWNAHGIATIHMQHPGSDPAVYAEANAASVAAGPDKVAAAKARQARLAQAIDGSQLGARVADASFILDRLAAGGKQGACDLSRIDSGRAGIAGHSMGAWVAQAIAGQVFDRGFTMADRRFRAAIGFSGQSLARGDFATAFGKIAVPYMTITSRADGVPARADAAMTEKLLNERTRPFAAMPPGQKYLLVMADGEHQAFAGNRPNPQGVEVPLQAAVKAATTAFWGATLMDDAQDAALLAGDAVPKLLGPGDRWEKR